MFKIILIIRQHSLNDFFINLNIFIFLFCQTQQNPGLMGINSNRIITNFGSKDEIVNFRIWIGELNNMASKRSHLLIIEQISWTISSTVENMIFLQLYQLIGTFKFSSNKFNTFSNKLNNQLFKPHLHINSYSCKFHKLLTDSYTKI